MRVKERQEDYCEYALLPSSSPLKSAKRMKPGVSSSLLSRFFQTSSKSWAFSGLTYIGRTGKIR